MPPKKTGKKVSTNKTKVAGSFLDDISNTIGTVANTAEQVGHIVQTGAELAPLLGLGRKVKALEAKIKELENAGKPILYDVYSGQKTTKRKRNGGALEIAGEEKIAGEQKIAGKKKATSKQKKINFTGGSELYDEIMRLA